MLRCAALTCYTPMILWFGVSAMKRREFIRLLGGMAAVMPLRLNAQEAGRIYRIGFLTAGLRQAAHYDAFFDELRMAGFIEGQNLAVAADGFNLRNERLTAAAAAIVKSAPDAIISAGPVATRSAQAATKTIPILALSDNIVEEGLVSSLARSGGAVLGQTAIRVSGGSKLG